MTETRCQRGSSCPAGKLPPATGLLAVVLLVSTVAALGGDQTVGMPQQTVVQVTEPGFLAPAELSVAINPVDPEEVVIVSLAAGPPGGPRITDYGYVSHNGGLDWATVPLPNPESRTQGDDAVTFDTGGTAFHSYIAFEGIRVERPEKAWNGIFVNRSADGGATWSQPVPVVDHINTVEPFEDKPWIVTDNAPESDHFGNVYVAWTRFDVYGSSNPNDSTQILFSRSLDRGESFSVPIRISDSGGDAKDSDDTVEGAVPAVGPDGQVYVVWAGPEGLVFDRSLDGGWTFGEDRVISRTPGGWDIPGAWPHTTQRNARDRGGFESRRGQGDVIRQLDRREKRGS